MKEARENRGALVAAALTILRAYIVAGRPGNFTPLGGFKDYDLVRGALLWLGMADPDTSREEIVAHDPTKGELGEILIAWREAHGDRPMKVAAIASYATANEEVKRRLYDLLVQVGGGKWDAPKIGRYLNKKRDQPVDGLAFRIAVPGRINSWCVSEVQGGSLPVELVPESAQRELVANQQEEIPF